MDDFVRGRTFRPEITEGNGEAPSEAEASRKTSLVDALIEEYFELNRLSGQQRRLLRLHLRGFCNKAIAAELNCSTATVGEHWRRIVQKTSSRHRTHVFADVLAFLRTHALMRARASSTRRLGAARHSL